VHNDDTSMRVLKLKRPPGDQRTGVFTTGVAPVSGERRIATYFTGRQHAGENLAEMLRHRAALVTATGPEVRCVVAQPAKTQRGIQLLLANCMAHGRRQFVDVAGRFPDECR
jgi:transposase